MDNEQLVILTADIVSAHVANNKVAVAEIGGLVQQVHEALAGLGAQVSVPEPKVPAVSIRASVKQDRLICMECGKPVKILKRHLQAAHGMTPGDYRRDYGLPDTYPMAAPAYSQRRAELAKSFGLGRKKDEKPGAKRSARSRKSAKAGVGER